jgi:hypothetical protein
MLGTATPLVVVPNLGPNQLVLQAFTCQQTTPATTWTCNHNFNDIPVLVNVFDTNGMQIFPDTTNASNPNTTVLTFVTPQAGTALISHAAAISIGTGQPNSVLQNPIAGQVIQGPSLGVSAPTNFTSATTSKTLNFSRYVDASNVSGWSGANAAAWIQSAINDCGAASCTVIVNANVAAGFPASLPDNVTLWDYRNGGRLSIITSPTQSAAGSALGLRVSCGPLGFNSADPGTNDFVALYGKCQSNGGKPTWGINTGSGLPSTVPDANLWGAEINIGISGTAASRTGQYIGVDVVGVYGTLGDPAPPAQPTFGLRAFSIPSQGAAFHHGFEVDGVSDDAYHVHGADVGMLITQAITSTGVQTVTTNINSLTRITVGQRMAVDSGGNAEDVLVTNISGVNVTGNFTKTHVINTPFTAYTANRVLEFGGTVTNAPTFHLGSLNKWAASNTTQFLSFSVDDSTGVERLTDFYTTTNQHVWRDVGGGQLWQNTSGATLLQLSPGGVLSDGGAVPYAKTIASGTATMTTTLIGAGACGTTVTVSAAGVATTDAINYSYNVAVGANPGVLILNVWPTANNVNFAYCNGTAAGVTPGAAKLNWKVIR